MKSFATRARLAALPLALSAIFPALAQTQLKEVVVTATRFPEPADSLPMGVSVITSEDIRISGVNSVNDAVMKLLGVPGRLDTSGGNNYTLDLRGFGTSADSNQVIIVDGLRLNEADLSSAGLASIPIESVARIEVLRGSGSVLYGEGATGGAIVVTTKAGTGAQRVNSASLYGAVGSNGLRQVRAGAALASGAFSLDVSADDRQSDGHRVNFASESSGLSASGQWSNDWLRLGVRAGRSLLQSGLPGSLTAAQYTADPHQSSRPSDFGSVRKDNAGVFAEGNIGNWVLAADANTRTKKYSSTTYSSPYAYDVDAANYSVRARNETMSGANSNVFVTGIDRGDWDRVIVKSSYTAIGTRAKATTSALYFKDDFTLTSTGTRLSAGWRTERLNKSEASSAASLNNSQRAWELGLSQQVTGAVTAYGRIGQSFRLPNVDEFSFTTPGTPLKAQTSRDIELGTRWKIERGQVELRWYHNELTNEIGYDPKATGPYGAGTGANINFDPTRRQGLELEARHALTPSLDLRVNAALRLAKFTAGTFDGKDVALVPGKTIAVRADWKPAAGHSLGGGVNWVSSQRPDFANACTMPSYTTVDARYAYQTGNLEFALGIANLTDRKYYTQAFGCTAGVTTSIYPEAGRTITASLLVKF